VEDPQLVAPADRARLVVGAVADASPKELAVVGRHVGVVRDGDVADPDGGDHDPRAEAAVPHPDERHQPPFANDPPPLARAPPNRPQAPVSPKVRCATDPQAPM